MRIDSSIYSFWSLREEELIQRLSTSPEGLSSIEASARLRSFGRNEIKEQKPLTRFLVLWNQIKSPLLLILVIAAIISSIAGEWVDSVMIIAILFGSVLIGYSREYKAQSAAEKLQSRLRVRVRVLRDRKEMSIDLRDIVPGDVVLLSAGNLIPADSRILESKDFFINEAVLTGESFPVEKKAATLPDGLELSQRSNCVFLGTNVRSGTARCLVVNTGKKTEFGAIAHHLVLRPPETEFDRGIRRFGYFLTVSMFVMTLLVLVGNLLLHKPLVETLLFSIALAVGLSPELLPAILNINLARGAQLMARHGVLVRRLSAIENLGSMNILCTDKTGTLTEGVVSLEGAYSWRGEKAESVLELALLNAHFQSGLSNPLDEAILKENIHHFEGQQKRGEVPYDFVRKRMSVVVTEAGGRTSLIAKGALEMVLAACSRLTDGEPLNPVTREKFRRLEQGWTGRGFRVLGVAVKQIEIRTSYSKEDEKDLSFAGFLTFLDRPKEGVAETVSSLKRLGVSIKVISGDSANVAKHIAAVVGLDASRVLTGKDLDELHDEALWRSAGDTDIFAEVDPNQKERIILSLKKMGNVVGFLGDGINDAPAMHAADTSVSVDQAADVARAAADFVLLEKNLDVIRRGIEEGRKTFANTLKYILMTTSANLGNMLSMAVASVVLPFLPLLAGQVLLNNFLSDLPAIGLADDNVDPELVDRPRRWDMHFIGRFMVEFGVLSSLFDFLTFAALIWIFAAAVETFRTSWFVESLLTELVIALVIRTRRPFFKSRPGKFLLISTLGVAALALTIPFLSVSEIIGFAPLTFNLLFMIVSITVLYVGATELLKKVFYRSAN